MNKKLLGMLDVAVPILIAVPLLIAVPAQSWAATGKNLDVKTGLWEITRTTEMSGMPPIPADVLAKMPPERREKMQQMMQARQAQGAKTHVSKSCITEEKLSQPFKPNDERESHCKHTVVSQSSTAQDIHFECEDDQKQRVSTGDFHFEASDREHIKGVIKVNASGGGNAMKMNMQMSAKWLSADCGKVTDE